MTGSSQSFIRGPRDAARLSRTFSQSLSAGEIAEPLASLDESQADASAAEILHSGDRTVLGVRRAGVVTGWVTEADLTDGALGEKVRGFEREQMLEASAGLDVVLQKFAAEEYVFIEWLGEVVGVITPRDLQKPPVRMWLFGAITVLDANMTWAIQEIYPADGWQDLVSPRRLEKAVVLRDERRRIGSDCQLVDCLQIADKATILTSERAHISALGLPSRKDAERLMRGIEALRNHLAHAQDLDVSNLVTATKLAAIIDSILRAEGVQRILAARAAGVGPTKPVSEIPITAASS